MNRRRVNIARKESEQQYQVARPVRPGAARAEAEGHARHDPRLARGGGGREPAALTGTVNSCASNLLSWLKISWVQAEPFSSA